MSLTSKERRQRRAIKSRLHIRELGVARLTVHRSHRNLACQIIDDTSGKTLVAVGTKDKDVRTNVAYGGNKAAAQAIGKLLAEKAIAAGIKQVAFDRGHYKYHGRVAALADAAREAGLSF